jgi:hypothetical protein
MEFVAVFATCVIAFFTIALFVLQFLQHRHEKKVSRANYALALYEKRLEVYFEIEQFFSVFFREGRVTSDAVSNLRHKCRNARFLFPDKPLAFVDEIVEKSFQLGRAEFRWEPLRERAEHDRGVLSPKERENLEDALNEMHGIASWFRDQINQGRLAAEFDPYLKLPESL